MFFYCEKHNEQLEFEILTHESLLRYGHQLIDWDDGCGPVDYIGNLRERISELDNFLKTHTDCGIVVNNEKGQQMWPENRAEKEKSDADKGLPSKVRTTFTSKGNMPSTKKLTTLLKSRRCFDRLNKIVGRFA